jgi:ABC-type phosphate transport system permease subunit
VLGYYLLVALGNQSPVGRMWQDWTGSSLAFTFNGLLIASVLYSLPFAVQPMLAAFSGVDRSLIEASSVLGRSWMSTVVRVVMPLSTAGLATAIVPMMLASILAVTALAVTSVTVERDRGTLDDPLGGYALTLVDTLDMLAVLGDYDRCVRFVCLSWISDRSGSPPPPPHHEPPASGRRCSW